MTDEQIAAVKGAIEVLDGFINATSNSGIPEVEVYQEFAVVAVNELVGAFYLEMIGGIA